MSHNKLWLILLLLALPVVSSAEVHVNDAGTWKSPTEIHVNDGGTWKAAQEVYVNDAGVWTLVFNASSQSYVKVFGKRIYPLDTPVGGNNYCVRNDGVAAKASATNCGSAETSMSVSTFNGSTFSDKDIVSISSRGGALTTNITIPTGGTTSASRITYRGEPGYTPTLTASGGVLVSVPNVDLIDITVDSIGATNFEFNGSIGGIRTYNLRGLNSGNQTFQHLLDVHVDHYNLYAYGATDEGFSSHENAVVNVYGGVIENCYNGVNYVGAPTLAFYNLSIVGVTGGKAFDPAPSAGASLLVDGGYFEESGLGLGYMIDLANGAATFRNTVFCNLTDGSYYLLLRSTLTVGVVENCLFIGNGTASTTAIYNQLATSRIKNNIFYNTITGGLYSINGAENNIFYNSGVAKGTNASTADPNFADVAGRDYSFDPASPAYQSGADLSAFFVSDYLTDNKRAGVSVWDIGPLQISQ